MLRLDALIARLLLLYELIYPKLKQNIKGLNLELLRDLVTMANDKRS